MKLSFKPSANLKSAQPQELVAKERRKSLVLLLSNVCAKIELEPPKLFFKEIKRGYACYERYRIALPYWLLERPVLYQELYLLHEIAHHKTKSVYYNETHGHDSLFMLTESKLCKQFANTVPLYNRNRGYCIGYISVDNCEFLFDGYGFSPESGRCTLII